MPSYFGKTNHEKNLPRAQTFFTLFLASRLEESTIRMHDERWFHRTSRVKYFIIEDRARTVKSLLSLRLYMTQKKFAYMAAVFSLLTDHIQPWIINTEEDMGNACVRVSASCYCMSSLPAQCDGISPRDSWHVSKKYK